MTSAGPSPAGRGEPVDGRALHRLPLIRRLLPWLLIGAYLLLAGRAFGPYLADDHAFRQSQTAIAAYYFDGVGDFLRYRTPVLGAPWSIPFEFPLYQALAKALHAASGLSLVTSGRCVSVAFHLACLWPLAAWLRLCGVRERALVLAPFVISPLYLFWSRAFLIETTALFFALLYGWRASVALGEGRASKRVAIEVALAGSVAALIKATTFAPLLVAAALAQAVSAWRARHRLDAAARGAHLRLLAAQGTALLAAALWVVHTDAVKLESPLGAYLSSSALRSWNFGSWAQRTDADTWWLLLDRGFDVFFPAGGAPPAVRDALVLAGLVVLGISLWRCPGRRRLLVLAMLAMYVLPLALFTNLHRVHNYYQAANGVFLCLAVGLAVQGAAAAGARWLLAPYAVLLLAAAHAGAWQMSMWTSHSGWRVELSEFIRRSTSSDSVLVITGQDWSPLIPFQSQRRALMLPWGIGTEEARQEALQRLRASGDRVDLYIACGPRPSHDEQARRALGLAADAVPAVRLDGCGVHRVPPSP